MILHWEYGLLSGRERILTTDTSAQGHSRGSGPAQQKDVIAESERKMLGSVANRRIAYAELHSIIYIGGSYQVLVSIDQIGRFARLVDTVIYSQV